MKTAEDEEFERIEREIKMRLRHCNRCGEKLSDVHTCTPKGIEVSAVFHEGQKMFTVPAQPAQQEPVAWKLMPRDANDAMLKAMDECSTEGYAERLYAGHAASVYMAAWDVYSDTGVQMSKEAMKQALEFIERVNKDGWILADFEPQMYATLAALREALAQPAPVQEPVAGCVCRWSSEGDRVVTCERHQGWLEVIAEWADRARDAEKKLKALNTSPPAQRILEF